MTVAKSVETQGVEYGAIRTELDQKAVERYLVENMPGFKLGSIHQFSFGQSNPTYLINSASDPPQQYVLRKKPPGKLVSQTAHAIEREYKIIKAIGEDGTVPVPKVYALCLDASVLGTPFYVMEYIKGRIFTDVRMPEVETKEERTKCWMSIIKTLASLHKLNPDKIGLGDFGSKAPFYPRQIKSLSRVSKAQALVKDDLTGHEVGEIPGFDFLIDWYSKNAPEGCGLESGVIHGDFKCDNMVSLIEDNIRRRNKILFFYTPLALQIFHPTKPEVIGVLDWELSTLGHPYSDLANLLQPFYVPNQEGAPRPSALSALRDISEADLPIPSAEQLLKVYCKEMGQPYPLERWTAAVSFAFFRLAVITQGIAARAAKGQASSAKAKTYSTMFPVVGMLAVDTIERAGQRGGESKL
ncbi:BQ2448_4492 [Microbotryum intermedium]|uniref:BQ2448_4492 protein n=1 Tax=Microbotryum intermedium TaxID=269621 RepID=A0A238FKU2_9BASI|nr:BQ2448_4492 [Microbotryum intermedium]